MDDGLTKLMRRFGIPVTRENYLELNYMGDDHEPDAEEEANFPPRIRKPKG
jgi:hypothetical protein